MIGGGFGGSVLILLGARGADRAEQYLTSAYQREFGRPPRFYRVRSVDGLMSAGTS
jgi:galactokinase